MLTEYDAPDFVAVCANECNSLPVSLFFLNKSRFTLVEAIKLNLTRNHVRRDNIKCNVQTVNEWITKMGIEKREPHISYM
jgi:hypothetical protein